MTKKAQSEQDRTGIHLPVLYMLLYSETNNLGPRLINNFEVFSVPCVKNIKKFEAIH